MKVLVFCIVILVVGLKYTAGIFKYENKAVYLTQTFIFLIKSWPLYRICYLTFSIDSIFQRHVHAMLGVEHRVQRT